MANANLLAILAAAATGFLIGGLWYGPLFGKAWMAEHGFTEAQLRGGNMLKIYGLTFALFGAIGRFPWPFTRVF